jgi:polyhydroxyalkanoate synthesis regulator phasin
MIENHLVQHFGSLMLDNVNKTVAIEAQNAKIAELEKQVADLVNQLADLTGQGQPVGSTTSVNRNP